MPTFRYGDKDGPQVMEPARGKRGVVAPAAGPLGSTVGGNLSADHITGGPKLVCGGTNGGDVSIQQSSSRAYWRIGPEFDATVGNGECFAGVTIGGNLSFDDNLGDGDITDNRIANNLECHNNVPAPTGGGNSVGGNRTGQCAGF